MSRRCFLDDLLRMLGVGQQRKGNIMTGRPGSLTRQMAMRTAVLATGLGRRRALRLCGVCARSR